MRQKKNTTVEQLEAEIKDLKLSLKSDREDYASWKVRTTEELNASWSRKLERASSGYQEKVREAFADSTCENAIERAVHVALIHARGGQEKWRSPKHFADAALRIYNTVLARVETVASNAYDEEKLKRGLVGDGETMFALAK